MRTPATPLNATIAQVRLESPQITTVVYDTDDETLRSFTAGQFAVLRLPEGDGWSAPHPFTLSGAQGDAPQMTIKRMGPFTSERVPALTPGAKAQLTGPFGAFCQNYPAAEAAVLLAGGVGITPFLSVLRTQVKTGGRKPVWLFWGLASMEEAIAVAELEAMTSRIPLHLVYVLNNQAEPFPLFATGPAAPVAADKGFVCAATLQKRLAPLNASYYLCGPPAMHAPVLAELEKLNISADRVQIEKFTPPSAK